MQLTADQLGTLITLSAAATGSIIVILVNCITNSKCVDLSCGWGCIHCIRKVPDIVEDEETGENDEEEPQP